jgi:hypothetical protein
VNIRPPQLAWALLVIAAALIGGLAAAALVHVSLAVAVAVSVAAGVIAVLAAARWPARPAHQAAPAAHPAPAPPEAVVQLLPVARQPNAPWWDAAQAPPPAPSQAARRVPAPDLSSYLASTLVAQCPNCGAFRLDLTQAAAGWDFRCEACRHAWTWQPGTAWPPVQVAPRRRTQ